MKKIPESIAKMGNLWLLQSGNDIIVATQDLERVIQVMSPFEQLPLIEQGDKVFLGKKYEIIKYKAPKRIEEREVPAVFTAEAKTIQTLKKAHELKEAVDVLWEDTEDLTEQWHLQPLDRKVLGSEEFYQQKLHSWLYGYL